MRIIVVFAGLCGLAAFTPGACLAQYPVTRIMRPNVPSYQQPATSPYLNLLAGPFGYLQGTVPQENQLRNNAQFRMDYKKTQSEIQQQQKALKQAATSNLSTTGHAAGFMTHTRYFNVGVPGGQ